MQIYLLSITTDEVLRDGTIHDPNTKLKIKVLNVLKSKFTPNQGEVRFFVTSKHKTIAFETEGYKKHRELLILQMISWYCIYLGLIEPKIHNSWPEMCTNHLAAGA